MSKISVIIPCYNESENIPKLYDKLKELEVWANNNRYSLEVLFVNDASTDDTVDAIKKLDKDNKFIIISHERNKNLGGVLKTGFRNVTGDYVMTIDADLTYDPMELIVKVSDLSEKCDFISGTGLRVMHFYFSKIPLRRKIFSFCLPFLYNIVLLRLGLTYTSLFRIYKTNIVNNIDFKSNNFVALAEIYIMLIKKGYHVKEFGANYNAPIGRVSNMNVLSTIKGHLNLILRIIKGNLF